MEERNRVSVKIYGQEFIISGDQPRDHIIKVADYVDRNMHDLAATIPSCSVSSLAVLAAVNCADEYYRSMEQLDNLKIKNQQLEKDAQHYVQLWDEAKKSFLQYKEDAQVALEQKEELQRRINEKVYECKDILNAHNELKERFIALQRKYESLKTKVEAQEEDKESSISVIGELEARCKEMENNYFDLQMENIQLKAELERYKKMEQD